jgi:hypothetical protein
MKLKVLSCHGWLVKCRNVYVIGFLIFSGARGSVVVKALCCKPEGREFKSR